MSVQEIRQKADQRPTIGVMIDSMISGYQLDLWSGIEEAARNQDANLLCFVGREIDSTLDYRRYDL